MSNLDKQTNPMIAFVKDGFANIMKGLGTSKDPREYVSFQRGFRITQQIANDLYVYNWLAAKVVNIPVDDATRKWRNLLISDAEKKVEVEKAFNFFDLKGKVSQALKWSRVFGGSVIIAIIDGDDQEEPLDIKNIKKDSLKNFIVLDRYNLYPGPVDNNILSGNFGKPSYYTVSRNGQQIHPSRMVKFDGNIPTIQEYEQNNYWGTSIFTTLFEPISDSQVVSQSISNLIYESNVDVYKIAGFNALVAEGRDDIVIKRLKLAHEMKSIINGIALDSEDDYEKKTNTFTTLPDIDDRFMQKVTGASDIPVTRFIGTSPTGMNATGESDMLNYYDNVQSIQENIIRPRLTWLDTIVMASVFGNTEPVEYEFAPLKQLTEIEQAQVDLSNSQRDTAYLDQDVIKPIDAMAQLAENGTYVTIDEIRVQKEIESQELEWEEPEIG